MKEQVNLGKDASSEVKFRATSFDRCNGQTRDDSADEFFLISAKEYLKAILYLTEFNPVYSHSF